MTFYQLFTYGLSLSLSYALIAVGFSLLLSILFSSCFANGGYLFIGGFMCYMIMNLIVNMGVFTPIWTTGAAVIFIAVIAALVTKRVANKPINDSTLVLVYLIVLPMGIAMLIRGFFAFTNAGRFVPMLPQIPMIFTHTISIVLLLCSYLYLQKNKLELAVRATACDPGAAELLGVNGSLLIGKVFFIAGALATVGGILFSTSYPQLGMTTYRAFTIYPQPEMITYNAFAIAIIAVPGNLTGAIAGSFILGLAEALCTGFVSNLTRVQVVFCFLLIAMFYRIVRLILLVRQMSRKV